MLLGFQSLVLEAQQEAPGDSLPRTLVAGPSRLPAGLETPTKARQGEQQPTLSGGPRHCPHAQLPPGPFLLRGAHLARQCRAGGGR